MGNVTTNFSDFEFVHPDIWHQWGAQSMSWVNPHAPPMIQRLRNNVGGITINDWYWGGGYTSSGVRRPQDASDGMFAPLGGHFGGFCFDLKFDVEGMTTDEVFEHILARQDYYNFITRIENIEATRTKQGKLGRDWMHIETGFQERDGDIVIFNP